MAKIQDIEELYQCDSCKRTFKGKESKLETHLGNINFLSIPSFLVVDSDGTIIRTSSPKILDKFLSCPFCERIHFSGFNQA